MVRTDHSRLYRQSLWDRCVLASMRQLKDAKFAGSWRLKQWLQEKLPSRELMCRTQFGKRIIVNPGADPYQRVIYLEGSYEPGLLALMKQVLTPGDVFLDIGANLGLMTLAAATHVGPSGKVFAFEPEPRMYERCKQNIALNKLSNVDLINVALGAQKGQSAVYAFPDVNIGRASLVRAPGAERVGSCEIDTLDAFVKTWGVDAVKMVKIDVEGFEFEVLQGGLDFLKKGAVSVLCVECDAEMPRPRAGTGMRDLHELIMSLEIYAPYRLKGTKFGRSPTLTMVHSIDEVPRHDNVVYLNSDFLTETVMDELLH